MILMDFYRKVLSWFLTLHSMLANFCSIVLAMRTWTHLGIRPLKAQIVISTTDALNSIQQLQPNILSVPTIVFSLFLVLLAILFGDHSSALRLWQWGRLKWDIYRSWPNSSYTGVSPPRCKQSHILHWRQFDHLQYMEPSVCRQDSPYTLKYSRIMEDICEWQ